MSTGSAEHPVLVAAARHGLGRPEPPVALNANEASGVLARARFDHITGLLATAVLAGAVTVENGDVKSRLWGQWHEELLVCVQLEALAVRTAGLLDQAGISWRLTKGPALANLDYPDPSMRTFGDVDVVVHPDHWLATFELLSARGYGRESATLPGGYDVRFGKGATLLTPDGFEVDLHRRFAIGRFGVTARTEQLFTTADAIELGGRVIPVLDPVGRLLHACFHAALGGFSGLRAFRDVAQLVLVTGVDWRRAFGIAESWRSEAVLASAITDSWERLHLDVEHPAHDRAIATAVSRTDRRVLGKFGRGSTFRTRALSAIPRLPPHDVPRYLWCLAAPKLRGRA